jgi:hypothetical protein
LRNQRRAFHDRVTVFFEVFQEFRTNFGGFHK